MRVDGGSSDRCCVGTAGASRVRRLARRDAASGMWWAGRELFLASAVFVVVVRESVLFSPLVMQHFSLPAIA